MVHIIHGSSEPGGIEVLIPEIIDNMSKFEFEVFVLRPPKHGAENIYANKNITVEYGANNNLSAFFRLWLYARKRRKHLFHVYSIGPLYLFALRLAGVKRLVCSIHGAIFFKKNRRVLLKKIFWRLSLSKRYVITANSEYCGSVFKKQIIDHRSVKVLYNPIYGSRINLSKEYKNDEKFTVIYVGRLAQGKNLPAWIDLATILHKVFPDINFAIYGEGPLREELERIIKKNNAEDYIHMKGFMRNIKNVYVSADLLLFLSEYESFGNVVVESILCGTPVIASSIPSMREIFRNYPDFLIELDGELAQNLIKKIEQIENLQELVPFAREDFEERFSLNQHVQKLKVIYESLS